ncbi:zinc-finger homeodomain protein 6 [Nicotiana sylvestris]|uniref:Zinc-finger homeodomain protein 6 n=1 Tax=Nicotiana sylvestris TaxID=4096 RepID=A0A1U7YKV1_NICSY|nr:PREDICTED: zinc-finger homeodomain protein 6 [Nicotiana sylvestris]
MEHTGQDKDMGMPNCIGFNSSHLNQQESTPFAAAKLPTAPIVSSLPDRTRNEQISHGNTIFSPNQTLDHQHNLTPNSDPDPTIIAAQLRQQSTTSASDRNSSIRYKECLKNHAASMGGHVLDGCGEFMPSGEEGTPEYLKCAACDCHRNFHRKETEDELQTAGVYRNNSNSHRVHIQTPPSLPVPPQQQHHHKYSHNYSRGPMPPVMMNFGGNTGVPAESSSEDLNMFHSNAGGQGVIQPCAFSVSKKRFRTKFTQQQKEKMQEFAEKLEWRIQKQDEQEVQQFCNEVGVKRQVFKVFMHNCKQAIKRKQT